MNHRNLLASLLLGLVVSVSYFALADDGPDDGTVEFRLETTVGPVSPPFGTPVLPPSGTWTLRLDRKLDGS